MIYCSFYCHINAALVIKLFIITLDSVSVAVNKVKCDEFVVVSSLVDLLGRCGSSMTGLSD